MNERADRGERHDPVHARFFEPHCGWPSREQRGERERKTAHHLHAPHGVEKVVVVAARIGDDRLREADVREHVQAEMDQLHHRQQAEHLWLQESREKDVGSEADHEPKHVAAGLDERAARGTPHRADGIACLLTRCGRSISDVRIRLLPERTNGDGRSAFGVGGHDSPRV